MNSLETTGKNTSTRQGKEAVSNWIGFREEGPHASSSRIREDKVPKRFLIKRQTQSRPT